jgi:hypothetical protein
MEAAESGRRRRFLACYQHPPGTLCVGLVAHAFSRLPVQFRTLNCSILQFALSYGRKLVTNDIHIDTPTAARKPLLVT